MERIDLHISPNSVYGFLQDGSYNNVWGNVRDNVWRGVSDFGFPVITDTRNKLR